MGILSRMRRQLTGGTGDPNGLDKAFPPKFPDSAFTAFERMPFAAYITEVLRVSPITACLDAV